MKSSILRQAGAVQFLVTTDWQGRKLAKELTLWVAARSGDINKRIKPDCPHATVDQLVVAHPDLPGLSGCVCECVGRIIG